MQRLKTLAAAIGAIFALTALLSALTATTASAVDLHFLPGTVGTKFTSLSGPGTLATEKKGTIECTKDKDEGILVSSTEALVTVDFEKCKALGIVGARSLGDPSEVILVHGEVLLCWINKAEKDAGAVFHTLPVHIEVSGKLLEVIGWAIGLITPVEKSSLAFLIKWEQTSAGVQKIKKCEGGVEETLLTAENNGTFEKSSEVTEDTIGFLVTAQEIMES
jgi:hypothetical protein